CATMGTPVTIDNDKIKKERIFILVMLSEVEASLNFNSAAIKSKRFLDFARNDRRFVDRWNSKRTQCFSGLIRRLALLPLSWARPARFAFIGGKTMDRQLPMSSRSIHLCGP